MRKLTLSKSGLNKIRSHQKELKASDLEDSIKSCTPGEWCVLTHAQSSEVWISFVNPMVNEKFASVMVLTSLKESEIACFSPENFISVKITDAYRKRLRFSGYASGCRVFYGNADGLPGLIADKFKNAVIIQINTAGLDQHRELIKNLFSYMLKTEAYLLDNAKYRKKESLPVFSNEKLPDLEVVENDIRFQLRSEVIQKVGFYYDHRENRKQLTDILSRLEQRPKKGLDLFSYAGAWGLNALKAGVESVDFVDQGDFDHEIEQGLKLNGFAHKGQFVRGDVFKFLDDKASRKEHYDLILCDPPAFAKNLSQKDQALEGYSKLHRKAFKVAAPEAVCVFSSCTHYVSHGEFQKNVLDAANKEGRKIQLIACGIQGWDHPVNSLDDRSNYIKSYIYLLES